MPLAGSVSEIREKSMKKASEIAVIIFRIIIAALGPFVRIVGGTLGFLFAVIWLILWLDREGDCASSGKVWDSDENRCREDCLTWNSVNGCIYINEEYQFLFQACADKTPDCDEEKLDALFDELCKKYKAPKNLEYGYCDFEFELKNCFKLEGDWEYPEECYQKP